MEEEGWAGLKRSTRTAFVTCLGTTLDTMPRYDRYSASLIRLLQQVKALAGRLPGTEMTPSLVLEAFLRSSSPLLHEWLENNGLVKNLPPEPSSLQQPSASGTVTLSAALRRDLEEAEAATSGTVTEPHVLTALWADVQPQLLKFVRRSDGQEICDTIPPPASGTDSMQETAVAAIAEPPPLGGPLAMYGRDLAATPLSHPLVGRDRELQELTEILLKVYKPNAILLGDAGVGKTAIVEALAHRMRSGDVPLALRGKRIIDLPVAAMVAGTKFRGQFESRLRALIEQAESDPSIILFLDEIHMLVGAGVNSGDSGDAADLLKPALARGRLRVIGATTWREYYESIETDPAVKRRFHEVRVEEPSAEASAAILAGVMPGLLAHHHLAAGADLIPLVISLCASELPSRRFPDKAIDVVDRACANASLSGANRLDSSHIRAVIAGQAGIAFTSDSAEFRERLVSLEDRLKQRVLRQDLAVNTVAKVVRLCKRRLDLRTHRPDGVFLFVGKSGVGKTALANALAETLLGSDDAVIHLDMTGFTSPSSVSTLLGSGPGYVNSSEEPAWLEKLRKTPSAILLLDELEKAHPDVTKVFLRAFDEGLIVDARGREYSLANVTVIATSNAYVDMDEGGFGLKTEAPDDHRKWVSGLQEYFAPEFLNRFDEIVPFEPLTKGDLGIILRDKILPQAAGKLLGNCNVRLQISDAAIRRLSELADSDNFGARELERVFRNHVLLPAAEAVHTVNRPAAAPPGTVVVDRAADGGLNVAVQQSGA